MKPYFSENDTQMFYKYLDRATNYFEFGSGGSTYQAAIRPNIKNIYSVESDKEWHNKLKNLIKDTTHITFIYNEMHTKPNNWGHPGINSTTLQKISYSSHFILLDESVRRSIDFIVIDGRFRVACCLKCFDSMSPDCLIAFDDFLNRFQYHIVLNYFDLIEKTIDNKMVILQKKRNCRSVPNEVIQQYELIPD